ncbi:unnamed protein product, partial [Polarella glacialis]
TIMPITVILENPSDLHNVERICRACRVFGVTDVRVVLERTKPSDPRCQKAPDLSGSSADFRVVQSSTQCLKELASGGPSPWRCFAATLEPGSVDLYTLDFAQDSQVAIWFGQEKHGLSPEASEAAAVRFFIPTVGMVQSLNVAASLAVTLAEVCRQRLAAASARSHPLRLVPEVPDGKRGADDVLLMEDAALSSISQARIGKFLSVAKRRQKGLVLVLENPDRLDAAAILRSCDAFGAMEVHFIFEQVKAFDPLANRQVIKSEGSNLWVCHRVFTSVADCADHLARKGFKSIAVGKATVAATSVFDCDLTSDSQVALWLGRDGVLSESAASVVSAAVCIQPAVAGDSLVLSSSVAVILAEIARQRRRAAEELVRRCPSEETPGCGGAKEENLTASNLEDGGEVDLSPEYQRLGNCRAKLARQGW